MNLRFYVKIISFMVSKKFIVERSVGITSNSAAALMNTIKITFGLLYVRLIEKMQYTGLT